MNENNSTAGNLFSIDVEAHLKKAASHTFGSPSHYPVELVRAALRRGAGEVDIRMGRTRIRVTDNGAGLDADALKTLTCLLDPTQPTGLKETAVEIVQDRAGFGLLAIFAPAPGKIIVENVSVLEKTRIVFEKGRLEKFNSCDLSVGTRITLFSIAGRNPAREKYILQAYCRSVQSGIYLNNRLISRGPLLELPQLLASLNISGSSYISRGILGIPRFGDICRLRLLDLGIPYRYITFPPHKGFIFDAAVEYPDMSMGTSNGEITVDFLDHLAEYAFQLYQWLCRNHASAPSPIQDRMEELIFDHYRFTRSQSRPGKEPLSFLEHFAPFKVLGTSNTITLTEIKNQGHTSPVFAVPRHKEHLRYNILGKTVLSLTREQADLLVNLEKLPITFLAPVYQKEKRLPVFFFSLKKDFKRFVFRFFGFLSIPSRRRVLGFDQLTLPEQLFMKALNGYLARESGESTVEAMMVSSRGPFPAIPSRPLLIRRDHSLVRKAVDAVQADPRNVEIFMPLITSGGQKPF